MHALIIEQETWVALMIEDVLRELGYTSIAVASSGEGALAAASARCPDLITSDLRLDSGTGVEAVRRICSARPIPVVYVTATPWELREAGVDGVVVPKPFGPAALREGVARATSASSTRPPDVRPGASR